MVARSIRNLYGKMQKKKCALFEAAMQGVEPLKHTKYHDDQAKPIRPAQVVFQNTQQDNPIFSLSDPCDGTYLSPNHLLQYEKKPLPRRLLQKLKRGQIISESTLDLHGYSVEQAREQVSTFIHHALVHNQRCIMIIHGKGNLSIGGKIKTHLAHWLTEIPQVLAYCSTQVKDGGTGSVYVLLKLTKQHEE